MFFYIFNCLIVSFLLFNCNAASVGTIKCSIKDTECLKTFYQEIFSTWTTTGFPELGVKSIDPLNTIEKTTISLNNELNIIINRGSVTGMKNCTIEKYNIDLDKGIMSHEVHCNSLKIDAHLSFSGSNSLIKSFLGGKELDDSDAHATITTGDLELEYQIRCKVIKGEDGKTYITFPDKKNEHSYKLGNVKVDMDKLIVGGQNMGPMLTEVINANAKPFLNVFGSPIIDKILEHMIFPFEGLLSQIPTQNFITDDLASYV